MGLLPYLKSLNHNETQSTPTGEAGQRGQGKKFKSMGSGTRCLGSKFWFCCVTLGKFPMSCVRVKLDHACKALWTVSGMEQVTNKCLLLLLLFLWTFHYMHIMPPSSYNAPNLHSEQWLGPGPGNSQVMSNGGFVPKTQPDPFQYQVPCTRGRLVPAV